MIKNRIILVFLLFLGLNLSAMMEQGATEVKIHLPSSNALADDSATAIRNEIVNDTIKYDKLVSILAEQAKNSQVFGVLHNIATMDKEYDGLKIRYLAPYSDILDTDREVLLFHGTRSTLEILDKGHLNAYTSKSGWGIFFGRNFHVSHSYATDRSSNIHETWTEMPVRGVLVLRKDSSKQFRRNDAGNGMVKEYILEEETYSLDNLRDIVFLGEEDVLAFIQHLSKKETKEQAKLRKVNIYTESYKPLKEEKLFNEFTRVLHEHPEVFSNRKFLEGFIDLNPFRKAKISPLLLNKLIDVSQRDLPGDNTSLYLALKYELSGKALEILRLIPANQLGKAMTASNGLTKKLEWVGGRYSPFDQALINGEDEFLAAMFEKLPQEDLVVIAGAVKSNTIGETLQNNHIATIQLLIKYLGKFPAIKEVLDKTDIAAKLSQKNYQRCPLCGF